MRDGTTRRRVLRTVAAGGAAAVVTGGTVRATTDAASSGSAPTASVDVSLYDGSPLEEATSVTVSGGAASGTVTLRAHKEDGRGHTYTIEVVAVDAAGTATAATAQVTEDSVA
jgi:hypothetical protein